MGWLCHHCHFSYSWLESVVYHSHVPCVVFERIHRQIHSKMCNIHLPYVKHALNVRSTHGSSTICLTYVFTIRYTCVSKNMRLTHGIRNMHFTIHWKALCLHITTLYCIKIVFLETYVKRTFWLTYFFFKTPVLRTLLHVRQTCVN